jgi:hypothetical protein
MMRLLSKLIALLKIYIADSLAYRASTFIWMLTDVVHCLVMPLVWLSAYGGRDAIAGYNPGEMVTYYVMIAFTTNFIVSHLMWDLAWEIKEGVPVAVAVASCARGVDAVCAEYLVAGDANGAVCACGVARAVVLQPPHDT